MDTMFDALRRRTGHAVHVEYGEGPINQPPLDASAALAVGFMGDGDTDAWSMPSCRGSSSDKPKASKLQALAAIG